MRRCVLLAAGLVRRATAVVSDAGATPTMPVARMLAAPTLLADALPPLRARGVASTAGHWDSGGASGGGGSNANGGAEDEVGFQHKCEAAGSEHKEPTTVFVRQLQEAGEEGDLRRVFDLVESRGQGIDEAGVEAALAQVAHCAAMMKLHGDALKVEVHANPTFQLLVDMAARGAKLFSAPAQARIVSVLGNQLRWGDQVSMDELGRSIMAGIGDLGPTHLSLLVNGLAAVGHSPGVLLLDAVRDRVRQLGDDVPPQQADRIEEALRKLGHPGLSDQGNATAPNPPEQEQPDRAQQGSDYA